MYLFIDAGNTRIKFAGHDGSRWLFDDAVPSDGSAPLRLPSDFMPAGILAVCVAGDATRAFIEQQVAGCGVRVDWFRASAECRGLRNHYENPAQLGPDRWSAAVGAWHQIQGACLVVSAGTATTIDVISADGVFQGGCIMPGMEMMLRALASGTAALPLADGHFADVPRNTQDAIYSGCLNAQLGAIERMHRQLPANVPVLLAGGAAQALRDAIAAPVQEVPLLVLEGLRASVS